MNPQCKLNEVLLNTDKMLTDIHEKHNAQDTFNYNTYNYSDNKIKFKFSAK